MALNGVMAVILRYFTATTADNLPPRSWSYMGTVPPPHISWPALYCIFCITNTVIGHVLRRRASTCGGIYARVYYICSTCTMYDVVVGKVHVRYLISWWASCFYGNTFATRVYFVLTDWMTGLFIRGRITHYALHSVCLSVDPLRFCNS